MSKEKKAAKTLGEIMTFTGMNEDQIASLLSENTIGKQKVENWSRPLSKALNDLTKREESYKRRYASINLNETELRVGAKRLQVEEIDLDKQLFTVNQKSDMDALQVIEFVEEQFKIEVKSGDDQLVSNYLKAAFPKVKVTMGLVVPEKK
jgi:hypothetical protein